MKFSLLHLLAGLCLLLPLPAAGQDREAVVRTFDGNAYQGTVSSRGDSLEWRKDIYEVAHPDGTVETFILNPEYKGRVDLSRIREIRRVNPAEAPRQTVTISNLGQANLIQKYLIVLLDGRNFYISDFITLENFYLDVNTGSGIRRIYLSQIERLLYTAAKSGQPGNKTAPAARQAVIPQARTAVVPVPAFIPKKDMPAPATGRNAWKGPDLVFILSITAGILGILLLILLYLLLKRTGSFRHPGGSRRMKVSPHGRRRRR